MLLAIFVGKKYKLVTLKICLVEIELPSQFHIIQNITGDPLKGMPALSTHLPIYTPMGRYLEEKKAVIDKVYPRDFLLLEECAFMHHFICQ